LKVLESEFSVLEQVISFLYHSKLIGGWIAHDKVVFFIVLVFGFGEVESSLDAEEANFAICSKASDSLTICGPLALTHPVVGVSTLLEWYGLGFLA
jgi:hypothetical protein